MAVVAAATTVPYEIYYAATNLQAYLSVFVANLIFVSVCIAAVWLNRARRHDLALDLMVTALYVHLFVITAFLSKGPGVHLFYFALGGSLELLTDEELDEETRREFLVTMRGQVDRLTKLATELLDLSRLDAGRIVLTGPLGPTELAYRSLGRGIDAEALGHRDEDPSAKQFSLAHGEALMLKAPLFSMRPRHSLPPLR